MKHINKVNLFLLIALILSLGFGPSSSAVFAKTEQPAQQQLSTDPRCDFSPLKPTGVAPYKVTFTADYNGSDVDSHLWVFVDGASTTSAAGSSVEHTFTGTNPDPHIRHQVWFHDGTSIQCSTWGKISDQPVPTVTQTPPAPPVGGNTSPANGSGCPSNIIGNGNTVICGNTDMNNTSVTNAAQPIQPTYNPHSGLDAFWYSIAQWIQRQ